VLPKCLSPTVRVMDALVRQAGYRLAGLISAGVKAVSGISIVSLM